jgi:hypothetical protein
MTGDEFVEALAKALHEAEARIQAKRDKTVPLHAIERVQPHCPRCGYMIPKETDEQTRPTLKAFWMDCWGCGNPMIVKFWRSQDQPWP